MAGGFAPGSRSAPVILLMGPTASGKTEAALRLADALPCDIISVDSAQVYRGLDIGTAKPPREVLRRYPHRLIDIRPPDRNYSVAEFRAHAVAAIDRARAHARIPLLVGGTTMYFQALLHGLSRLPAACAKTRAAINAQAGRHGWAALHQRLAEFDPEAAAGIDANDPQRIQRALEVTELTGQPMSKLWREQAGTALPNPTLRLVVAPGDRRVLHRAIDSRLQTMLDAGLVDEVNTLRQRYALRAASNSMRCVGYRQVWQLLEGELSDAALRPAIAAATRQLAKRQLTWLRNLAGAVWYDPGDAHAVESMILTAGQFIRRLGYPDP